MIHLLVDFDSKIPNLALMKISAWAKARGDSVELLRYEGKKKYIRITDFRENAPDHIWLSSIFTWNSKIAGAILFQFHSWYPLATIHHGGTAFDFDLPHGDKNRIVLPPEIENIDPDFSLYNDDRIVGFTQRGCDRLCPWCVVPRKEGKISENAYHPLNEWFPEGYTKFLDLDNDLALANRQIHDRTLKDAREMGLKISLTQGYDIREIWKDATRADQLADFKPYDLTFRHKMLYFSWDLPQYEKMVIEGIQHLLDAGFKPQELQCYVLVGYNTTLEQDIYRANLLRSLGVLTYIMPYNNRSDIQEINNLRRWANRRAVYLATSFKDYRKSYRKRVEVKA